jgi:hypothetical protein
MGKIRYESSVHRPMMLIICVESVHSVVSLLCVFCQYCHILCQRHSEELSFYEHASYSHYRITSVSFTKISLCSCDFPNERIQKFKKKLFIKHSAIAVPFTWVLQQKKLLVFLMSCSNYWYAMQLSFSILYFTKFVYFIWTWFIPPFTQVIAAMTNIL